MLYSAARILILAGLAFAAYVGFLEAQKLYERGGDWVGDFQTRCYYSKKFVDSQDALYAISARGAFIEESRKIYFKQPGEARKSGFRPCKLL
jgi:hypothetical protein